MAYCASNSAAGTTLQTSVEHLIQLFFGAVINDKCALQRANVDICSMHDCAALNDGGESTIQLTISSVGLLACWHAPSTAPLTCKAVDHVDNASLYSV